MTGTIKNVIVSKNFGFIRDSKGVEYFFHKEDFLGFWDDLVADYETQPITVEFEGKDTPKGARASNVQRLDHPNTAR